MGSDVEVIDRRRVVVAALPLSRTARARLAAQRVVVVEIEDWEFGIDLPGPVKRLLAAGADGYVTADSIAELAAQLLPAESLGTTGVEQAAVNSLPRATVDDVILSSLAQRLRHRHPSEHRQTD